MNRNYPLYLYLLTSFMVIFTILFSPIQYYTINISSYAFFTISIFVNSLFYLAGQRITINNCINFDKVLTTISKFSKYIVYFKIILIINDWVINGYQLLGAAYVSGYDGYERGNADINLKYIFDLVSDFFVYFYLIFAINNFFEKKIKYDFIICLLYVLFMVFLSGKQKYLGDFILLFTFFYILNNYRRKHVLLKSVLKYFMYFFILTSLFSALLYTRYEAAGINIANIAEKMSVHTYWDEERFLFILFKDFSFPLSMFLGYFTTGFYGLNMTLQLPFEFTYFIGSSYSFSRLIEVFTQANIADLTYPTRSESLNWGLSKWHTVYSWLASDFTFLGSILIVGLFFFYFSIIWKGCILTNDLLSKFSGSYFFIGIIFVNSNNQMLHSVSGLMFFLFLNLLILLRFVKKT